MLHPTRALRVKPCCKRRENLGYTLKDIAERTRVRTGYLESIEAENFKNLPAPVYIRGFIFEFARVLGIPEPQKISEAFLRQMNSPEK